MKEYVGKAVGIGAVGLGLLAFMIATPTTSPLYARTTSDPATGDPDSSMQQGAQQQGTQNEQNQMEQGSQTGSQGGSQTSATGQTGAGNADAVIANWPDEAKQAARKLIEKYGQPNGVLDDRLIWVNNGQFKETIAFRDGVEHNFPTRHMDYVKQTIALKVPVNKIGELSKFDGSLSYERTRGLLSSNCGSEDKNFLALNLANDIIKGKKTVDQARAYLSKTVQLAMAGKSSPELEGLEFNVSSGNTGDPDKPAIKGASSSKMAPSGPENPSGPATPSGTEKPSGTEQNPSNPSGTQQKPSSGY